MTSLSLVEFLSGVLIDPPHPSQEILTWDSSICLANFFSPNLFNCSFNQNNSLMNIRIRFFNYVVVSNACESDITPPRWKCLSVVPVVMPKSSKQGNYRIREFLLNKAGIFNMHHQPHWIINMPVKYFISGMFCLECPNWCQLIYCIPVHQTLWSVQETTNCACHTNIMYIL